MSLGRDRQYDDILRHKRDHQGRFPGDALTEKEQKDLTLWDKIRYYERIGRLKNQLRKLMGAEF